MKKRTWHGISLAGIFLLAIAYGRTTYAPCDDAYISFVYAKNLAEGNGLTFNGDAVWGFTSILWVLILAVPGLLGIPVHVGGEILSALSGAFALWATYRLGRACRLSRLGALLPPLLLAATGDFAFYCMVGLEQVLFLGLIALAAALVIDTTRMTRGRVAGIATVMAAMILTRPEGALVSGLLLLTWVTRVVRRGPSGPPFLCGLLTAGLLAPVLLAMRLSYGDWLPNTFYVKSNAGLANLPHGIEYMRASLTRYGLIGACVVVASALTILRRRASEHVPSLFALTLTAVWLMYVTLQGGDNLVGGRMLIPILPLAYVSLVDLAPRMPGRVAVIPVVLLCVGLYASHADDERVKRHVAMWHRNTVIRRATGQSLREHFAPETVVALNAAGIISYYSGLRTIDMLGLNDRHIAHHGRRDHRLRIGHQAGDGAYVLSRRPDVILFGRMRSLYVSDREIRASAEFREQYSRMKWKGRGPVFLRRGVKPVGIPAEAPGDD